MTGVQTCALPISILLIPFVGMPVLAYILYYVLASIGLIGVPVVSLSVMVIPAPIAGFLLGGGISLGIFLIGIMLLSCVVYLPFFKLLDAQALKEEQAMAAQKGE